MKSCGMRLFTGGLLLLSAAGLARADAPDAYASWAKVKVGTSVTLDKITETAGQKSETDITYTLEQFNAEKATVGMAGIMQVGNSQFDIPSQELEIPNNALPSAAAPNSSPSTSPSTSPSDSGDGKPTHEKLKLGGKTYDCDVSEVTSDIDGTKTTTRTWLCKDVPNLLVKSLTTRTGKVESKTTVELEKIESK